MQKFNFGSDVAITSSAIMTMQSSLAEKAVELDPKNSLYHQWLGTIYGGKADRDRSFSDARKVKKEFEEAVRLNPSNVQARRDLEQYLMEAPWVVGGNKDEARNQVTAIEGIDPIQGHLARAEFYLESKKARTC